MPEVTKNIRLNQFHDALVSPSLAIFKVTLLSEAPNRAIECKQKSAKERKRARKSTKGRKGALCKNYEQPGLEQPGLGTPTLP